MWQCWLSVSVFAVINSYYIFIYYCYYYCYNFIINFIIILIICLPEDFIYPRVTHLLIRKLLLVVLTIIILMLVIIIQRKKNSSVLNIYLFISILFALRSTGSRSQIPSTKSSGNLCWNKTAYRLAYTSTQCRPQGKVHQRTRGKTGVLCKPSASERLCQCAPVACSSFSNWPARQKHRVKVHKHINSQLAEKLWHHQVTYQFQVKDYKQLNDLDDGKQRWEVDPNPAVRKWNFSLM